MARQYLIALMCAVASLVLLVATALGSLPAKLLIYLVPLPGFIAGLGWGLNAGVFFALASSVLVAIFTTPFIGFYHLVSIGLPIAFLCYLVLLFRTSPPAIEASNDNEGRGAQQEWYPIGRVVFWTGMIAVAVSILTLTMFADEFARLRQDIDRTIETSFVDALSKLTDGDVSGENASKLTEEAKTLMGLMISLLPQLITVNWMSMMLLCLWLGGRVVYANGRLARPWPVLSKIDYPSYTPLLFVGAIGLTWLPDKLGQTGGALSAAFVFAYLLMGLAVLHDITKGRDMRPLLLSSLYLLLMVTGPFVTIALVIIGIGEPIFRLRARAAGHTTSNPKQ